MSADYSNGFSCDFPGCDKPLKMQGLCNGHDQQRRHGKELRPLRKRRLKTEESPRCKFPRCEHYAAGNGLCDGHYRQQRLGKELTPLYETQRRKHTPPRIICDEAPCPRSDLIGPCHIFRGEKDDGGYGRVRIDGRDKGVHVICWEREKGGSVAKGMEIDHQCRVRACCNTDHLREVTGHVNKTENVVGSFWMLNAAKTHCPRGHEYTPENTYRYPSGRECKTCKKEAGKRAYEKRKAAKC